MIERADLAERDRRWKRIRKAMNREGLQALIATGHASHFSRGYIRYFADWHIWSGDAMVLIPLEGDPALVQTAYAGADKPQEPWITDVRRSVYPQEQIVEAMKDRNLTTGKVGIAGFRRIITHDAYKTFERALPQIDFVDADVMTERVRMIKSPLEIQQYRDLWDLSKAAMKRFVEALAPGKTQREVAAEVAHVLRDGGCFDDMTAIREGNRRGLPKDVPLACDDLVGYHMEVCGPSSHWSEIDVICAFRDMSDLERKRMEAELRAYDEIRAMAKPGVRLSDMSRVFDRVLLEDGWELVEGPFHLDFHGHGMDDVQWPWYSPTPDHNQDVVLEENMVLCYHPRRHTEPSLSWGPEITDNLLITKDGGERLSGDWDLRWRAMT